MTALPTVCCSSPPSPIFRRSTREPFKEASVLTETQKATKSVTANACPPCEGWPALTLVDGAGSEMRRDACDLAPAACTTGTAVCFVDEPALPEDKLSTAQAHAYAAHKELINSSRRSLLSQLTAVTLQRSEEWLTQPCSTTTSAPAPATKSGELPVLATAIGAHATFCAAARMRFVARPLIERSNACGRIAVPTTPSLTSPGVPLVADLGARWAGRAPDSSHSLQGMLLEPLEPTAMQPLSPMVATSATVCHGSTEGVASKATISSPMRPRISLFDLIMPRNQQPFLSLSSLAANVGVAEQAAEVQRTLAAVYRGADDVVNMEQPSVSRYKDDGASCNATTLVDSLLGDSLPPFALAATATVSYARVTPSVERAAEDGACVSMPATPAPPTRISLSGRCSISTPRGGARSCDGQTDAAPRQPVEGHVTCLAATRSEGINSILDTVGQEETGATVLEQRAIPLLMNEFDARCVIEREGERTWAKLRQREVAAYLRVQHRLRRVARANHTMAVRFPLLFAAEKRRLVRDCFVREACAEAEHQQTMQRLRRNGDHGALDAHSGSVQPRCSTGHTHGTAQQSRFASLLQHCTSAGETRKMQSLSLPYMTIGTCEVMNKETVCRMESFHVFNTLNRSLFSTPTVNMPVARAVGDHVAWMGEMAAGGLFFSATSVTVPRFISHYLETCLSMYTMAPAQLARLRHEFGAKSHPVLELLSFLIAQRRRTTRAGQHSSLTAAAAAPPTLVTPEEMCQCALCADAAFFETCSAAGGKGEPGTPDAAKDVTAGLASAYWRRHSPHATSLRLSDREEGGRGVWFTATVVPCSRTGGDEDDTSPFALDVLVSGVGDGRAFGLARGCTSATPSGGAAARVVPLSIDHTIARSEELRRVRHAIATVGHTAGASASGSDTNKRGAPGGVTRGFGCYSLKSDRRLSPTRQILIALPTCVPWRMLPGDVLVMSNKTLYDTRAACERTVDELGQVVQHTLRGSATAAELASALCHSALRFGATGSLQVMVAMAHPVVLRGVPKLSAEARRTTCEANAASATRAPCVGDSGAEFREWVEPGPIYVEACRELPALRDALARDCARCGLSVAQMLRRRWEYVRGVLPQREALSLMPYYALECGPVQQLMDEEAELFSDQILQHAPTTITPELDVALDALFARKAQQFMRH